VVLIDENEQAEITPEAVFGGPAGIKPTILYETCGGLPTWTMEHDGYYRFKGLGIMRRRVRCAERRVDIEEHVGGEGTRGVDILFHLHPRLRCEVGDEGIACVLDGQVLCWLEVPERFRARVEKSWYSRAYAVREPHDVIILSSRAPLPLTIRYAVRVEPIFTRSVSSDDVAPRVEG
jgi:hypothetical protein